MIYGNKIVFGMQPLKPIRFVPEGQQRLRLRRGEPAMLFVRQPNGIRGNILIDTGDTWTWDDSLEFGRNVRYRADLAHKAKL